MPEYSARASVSGYIIPAVFVSFLSTIWVIDALRDHVTFPHRDSLKFGVIFFGFLAAWSLWLAFFSLRIDAQRIIYFRINGGKSILPFSQMRRAFFGSGADGVGSTGFSLQIEMLDGTRTEINLRIFPIETAVTVLDALEKANIPVDEPRRQRTRSILKRIRALQAKRKQMA